jgi:MFS family permease
MPSISKRQQYILLALSFSLPVGYTYNYDLLMALQQPLERAPFGLTLRQFNSLYSFTNLPAMVSCLAGGLLMDRWGAGACAALFLTGLLLANLLAWLAILLAYEHSPYWYYLLVASRLLLGTFGENSVALQSVVLSNYVDPSRLTLFIGLGVNMAWMFEAINNILTPVLFEEGGSAAWPVGAGLLLSALCCGLALLLVLFERTLAAQKAQSQS